MEQKKVEEHFDDIAQTYDYWKSKNWFYYKNLEDVARRYSVHAHSVLDAGCGTGTILSKLDVNKKRYGIDISQQMIDIARNRYGTLGIEFSKGDIADINVGEFDTVLFFDVIEHVESPEKILTGLARSVTKDGVVVISMANPLWEGILMIAEKLHMKMPEGPHYRIPASELIALASKQGLRVYAREWRLLFPKYIPVFSFLMNDVIGAFPGIRRLSCVEIFVFKKA